MLTPDPFCRESGVGPVVVCLHSNASSSSQWRPLMDSLSARYRVLAPDSHGAGKGPAWPTDRSLSLADEVTLLEPVFTRAGAAFSLVGHSYGAAVALLAALQQPQRVKALVLYEPTLFSLVDSACAPPNDADGIRHTVARAGAALARDDRAAAAEYFIDYWMGAGAWRAMPEARHGGIESAIENVQGWGHALFTESTPLSAFRALTMPVLLMVGQHTTVSARAVTDLLANTLPQVQTLQLDGLGHMGPVTHPERVNAVIVDFLRCFAAT